MTICVRCADVNERLHGFEKLQGQRSVFDHVLRKTCSLFTQRLTCGVLGRRNSNSFMARRPGVKRRGGTAEGAGTKTQEMSCAPIFFLIVSRNVFFLIVSRNFFFLIVSRNVFFLIVSRNFFFLIVSRNVFFLIVSRNVVRHSGAKQQQQ
jgi:hypothetical protein